MLEYAAADQAPDKTSCWTAFSGLLGDDAVDSADWADRKKKKPSASSHSVYNNGRLQPKWQPLQNSRSWNCHAWAPSFAFHPFHLSMSSLRRPPIECLFVSLFILFLFLFVVCRSETLFTGLVTQGHRSFGLEESARRARRRRTRWRHAMASLSRGAMTSTEG